MPYIKKQLNVKNCAQGGGKGLRTGLYRYKPVTNRDKTRFDCHFAHLQCRQVTAMRKRQRASYTLLIKPMLTLTSL